MARILVLGVKVPFTSGGQEVLVRTLVRELLSRGHEVDTVELPFNLPDRASLLHHAALWRAIDFTSFAGQSVDLVIATKFPSYYARHPKKSLWLVHQHRPIYDLYGGAYSDFTDSPEDEALRQSLVRGDSEVIRECSYISGISKNVSERLRHYNGIPCEPLYPPLPLGQRYRSEASEAYILSVGRICGIKRVDLMIKALPMIHQFVKLKIVGQPDEPGIMDYLTNEIVKHHLQDRVEFLGRVDDETLLGLYAKAKCVYYAPYNEDYGYVTLEALASGRPIVTAEDSGGTLEFVTNEETGLVVPPSLDGIAQGCNRFIEDAGLCDVVSRNGLQFMRQSGMQEAGWDKVIERLLSPLSIGSQEVSRTIN